MAHTFYPSTWEAEAGRFWVRGQPGLQSEFQDSQGYTEKLCLKKQNKTKKQTEKGKWQTICDYRKEIHVGKMPIHITIEKSFLKISKGGPLSGECSPSMLWGLEFSL